MIQRDVSARLLRLWADFPVVIVSGARQVGKTTLVDWLSPRLNVAQRVTLDHSGSRQRANEEPELFLQSLRLPAFVDEAHKSPKLFDAIKQQVDHDRRPGRLILSGSANIFLLKNVSESLAGRSARLFLRGVTVREILGRRSPPPNLTACLAARSARELLERCHANARAVRWPPAEWPRHLLRSRFPELVVRPRTDAFRVEWMEAYVDAFVEKDLPDFGGVRRKAEFRKFWRIAASAAARVQDLSSLGAALGVSYHTAARYLELLEQGCHLFHVEPYYANIGKRLTKSPKLFMEDTGLAVFLSGIRGVEQFEASESRGAWLENFVVAELKTLVETFFPGGQLWFWRTLAGAEVDVVVEHGRRLLPIEIKWSSRPLRADARGVEGFLHDVKPRALFGILACAVREPCLLTDHVVAVPLEWLLT